MAIRQYTMLDSLITECDKAVTTLFGKPETTGRKIPGQGLSEQNLTDSEKKLSIALMRVNHAGEVSAQGLYQGQAQTAKCVTISQAMEQAAIEENDHLVWCQQRLNQLGGHSSILNPLWYLGSFTIGAIAGKIGDKWSLGFVAETEKQVAAHLDKHLLLLSEQDQKSRAIVEQMKIDELHHGTTALETGGVALPKPIKSMMKALSKVMTKSSYWI